MSIFYFVFLLTWKQKGYIIVDAETINQRRSNLLTVTQTDFNGIDSLTYHEQPTPKLPANGVQLAMTTWPVVPSDWHRESQPDATAEQLATLPRIIGIGGVGEITAVGAQRDARLCHQRALVMHPSGSYAETIISTNPDWLFPLPATVSDADAAALTAGPGTATVLTSRHFS